MIWALWHLPFMLAGYNDGGGHPIINALVFFPLNATAAAFLIAVVVRSSGSLWAAAVLHTSNNSFRADAIVGSTGSWWLDKLAGASVSLVLLLIFALWLRRAKTSSRYLAWAHPSEEAPEAEPRQAAPQAL